MELALLVLHMMIAAVLVGVVLLQKSEGGALGIGGGGGSFLTGRGTANLLTRTTAILAAAFFTTSLALTLIANHTAQPGSIIEKTVAPAAPAPSAGSPATGEAAKPADAGTPSEAPKSEGHGILDRLDPPAAPIQR